ncbi:DapH/DapD/GlmU-related protein [Photobacterium damselae]|uniref:DapH/DapD/GlmU-related protein n=1 Tax=Photobacterium damselae TaxID=38293 RepID=UPI003B66DA8B
MIKGYNFYSIINLFLSLCYTKVFHSSAKLIRLPVSVRGGKHIIFGKNFISGRYCRIDAFSNSGNKVIFGENCQINDSVHIASVQKVLIGSNVLIASRVFITDHQHGSYSGSVQSSALELAKERKLVSSPVIIEDNVWLGEGAVVLPGVTIGENSVIGANAVVTKNIPMNSIACGVPAKVIKVYDTTTSKWINVE